MVYEATTLGFRLAIFTKDIKPSSIVHPHSQMVETHGDKVGFHIDGNCDRWLLQHRIGAAVNQLPKLFQFINEGQTVWFTYSFNEVGHSDLEEGGEIGNPCVTSIPEDGQLGQEDVK